MPKFCVVAGEASGDLLGGKLINAMKKLEPDAKFYGVGGERMTAAGLDSLFSMHDLSHMGFVEILPHLVMLMNRLGFMASEISKLVPDAVITIDSPGFNFRLAEKLQAIRPRTKLIHYVAPTVWAYKPERAAKIAKLYDHLLVILPFEPEYFTREGLDTTFIGHPSIEDAKGDAETFRRYYNIADSEKIICVMPGSRKKEIERHMSVFGHAMNELSEKSGERIRAVMPINPAFGKLIGELSGFWRVKPIPVTEYERKPDVFAASSAALVKSGTAALELAIAGVPMVVAHRVSPVSAFILRRMIKVDYVNIVNLLEKREIIPEFLQEKCVPRLIAPKLMELVENKEAASGQVRQAQEAIKKLYPPVAKLPSEMAAEKVLEVTSVRALS